MWYNNKDRDAISGALCFWYIEDYIYYVHIWISQYDKYTMESTCDSMILRLWLKESRSSYINHQGHIEQKIMAVGFCGYCAFIIIIIIVASRNVIRARIKNYWFFFLCACIFH